MHDGVVQELAGMSFALSAAAREMPDRPQVASRLEAIGGGVRHSLRALRSLLVEIYPPDLGTAGLAAALDDLVAPAVAAGLDVNLDVADTSGLSDDTVALVWRVAQESVRNVIAHAQATQLQVAVSTSSSGVVLEVVDNGVGFDPAQASEPGHLGLRGLQDLVAKAGGALEVRSGPSAGTTLRLEIGPS
ncbi:MAG: sensor histidine kinase [Nocardioidaceae bacterium]